MKSISCFTFPYKFNRQSDGQSMREVFLAEFKDKVERTLEACSYPGSRKPRPLAVDECANFWPGCPEFRRGMSPRLGVSQVPRPLPVGLHNWDKTPSLSYLYPLNYLKRTSQTEGFHSAPIQRCGLIHGRPRLRFFDEKEFDLQVDDRTSASGG